MAFQHTKIQLLYKVKDIDLFKVHMLTFSLNWPSN